MGDRRRRSLAMQVTQYQASLAIEDAEMNNEEAEFVNSFMQYEHHAKSSYRGSVTGCSFMQHDREECHDRMMKDYSLNPNREDLKRLLRRVDKRGLLGMIESLEYMHWQWKKCPTAWAGQFKGRHNKPTIMLEVVASYDT
ncbi:unnamed protein product [Malus baccata var. baccata]